MKRFIIASALLASMVLLGCEGPESAALVQSEVFGDFRDEINRDYMPTDADAEVFARYGITPEMFASLHVWTPEQVLGAEAAFAEIVLRALNDLSQQSEEDHQRMFRSLAEDGSAEAEVGSVTFEWISEPTEPIRWEKITEIVDGPNGTYERSFHIPVYREGEPLRYIDDDGNLVTVPEPSEDTND